MSRYRRDLDEDLAYGDYPPPNRWDRERFERTRVKEREREIRPAVVDDRRGRYEDRPHDYPREQRIASRIRREVLEDEYAREADDRALLPYRRREEVERERDVYIDIERRREAAPPPPPRPAIIRRQSSLDTFDRRRPHDRPEMRGALEPYYPPPGRGYVEYRRSPERGYEEYREDIHIHSNTPLEHRDVEIYREREIRKGRRAKSDVKSVASSHTSTSKTSDSSSSRSTSPSPVRLPGKKGHTKLPKAKFAKSAVARFGVPFDEEEGFFKVHRALDKASIDTILTWSREDNTPKVTTYSFEQDGRLAETRDHYEKIRTEWINPPSVRGASPARSHRTVRAPSPPPPPPVVQETKVVVEERGAPVYVQSPPPVQVVPPPPPVQPMAVQITERTERTHGDIEAEIRRLEAERELVRIERAGQHENTLVVRQPVENYQVVEYSPRSRAKSMSRIEYIRGRSPPRNVVRVEKDRRDKRPNPKFVAAMMATLS